MKHVFSYSLYCKYTMFYFLRKLLVPTCKKLTRLSLFEIKSFLTRHNRFFTQILFPHFGRWDANVITLPNQLALKQITNLQNTTAWLQNSATTFVKRPISKTTWDQESIRKISNWMGTDPSAQSPFWKQFFGNSSQKLHIADVGLYMFIIPGKKQ